MNRIFKHINIAIAILLLALTACSKKAEDTRPILAVSLEPQRYMLEQIVGDRFRIVTMMPNGGNPETFEPSMSDMIDLRNAEAYFLIGHLPFERALSLDQEINTIDTSDGIELIYGTHNHTTSHAGFLQEDEEPAKAPDPHIWTSVRNARIMARNMLATVRTLDPAHAAEYTDRYDDFDARLDSLDKAFASRLTNAKSTSFMVWHPSLTYFARDYGLEQISVGQENKDGSLSTLRNAIDEARADSVKTFFFQKDYDARQAKAIANEVGAKLIPVNPGSYEWEGELNTIVNELTRK